jgi:DNA-binding MarR family transcriptional regulator
MQRTPPFRAHPDSCIIQLPLWDDSASPFLLGIPSVNSPMFPSTLLLEATRIREALPELLRVVSSLERQRASTHGLSMSQCHALRLLADNGPLTVNDLAARLILEKSTASRLADALLGKGLVRKRPGMIDGRVVILQATETGLRLSRRIGNDLTLEYMERLAEIPREIRRSLPEHLGELARHLAARTGGAAGTAGGPA